MSARYVSSFDDWMDPWLLKLKSCGFLRKAPQVSPSSYLGIHSIR